MLTVDIRNLYNPKYDKLSGAALYLDPSTSVYPTAAGAPKPDAVSSWGIAQLNLASLSPGEHTLWVVPKFSWAEAVGVQTATSVVTDRIYRGLRIQLSTGGTNRGMTGAVIHASTSGNGTVLVDIRGQHLTVHLRAVWMKSPTHPSRNQPLDMIIVHKTGGAEPYSAVQTFISNGSPHYMIDREGHIIKFVIDSLAAGHVAPEKKDDQGGAYSHWGTQTALAYRSIGIENVGSDDQGLTDAQYQSLIRLIKELMDKHKILRHRVIGHSDVLTDGAGNMNHRRQTCPGWQFDWPRMEAHGIGLRRDGGTTTGTDPVAAFFDAMQAAGVPNLQLVQGDNDGNKLKPTKFGGELRKGALGKPIAQLQTWLKEIGYSVGPVDGECTIRMTKAVLHFQVHFIGVQANVGVVNRQTAALIYAVRQANPVAP
jgi:N-acetyl-anhydromuramyl-L-alanine amidase AmpD